MAATKEDIKKWMKYAKVIGATHIISVCDIFDYSDYPVYVMPNDKLDTIKAKYDGINMQRVNETITVV